MKKEISITGIIACSIILQAFIFQAQAQTPVDTASVTGSPGTAGKAEDHSFFAGAGYGSNMIYLGTTMSQDHSFVYSSLTYGFRDQLYLSAVGYNINDFSPFLAFYSIGINYNHTFNSWFDISLSLSQYNVAESLRDTLFNNFIYADVTAGFDWKILYSKVSLGGLISDGSQFYLQTRHSRYFETPSFAGDKAYFSFDPYINLLFGNIAHIETIEGTTTTLSPGYRPWKRSSQASYTNYTETFGLMEIDFGLPIDFNYCFFTLEIEPGYVLPMYSDTGTTGMKGFLFLVSAFFRIF
jgi:hypothetical protein